MRGTVLTIDPTTPDAGTIERAAALLRAGRLVAFPTETVYGLGANALDPIAVQRIFAAKGRPSYNPLIVHVPDAAAARAVVASWPAAAERAADAFWPGPLTLVLPRAPAISNHVTAGLDTVGVRVPAHPAALALLRAAGVPIAAPSANRFTRVSPTSADHVLRGLGDEVDLILDGGVTPWGIESTVLDLSAAAPRLLRHGAIRLDELEAVLGTVTDATTSDATTERAAEDAARPSPGMVDRHYSPTAEVVVFDSREQAGELIAAAQREGRRVGGLLLSVSLNDLHEVIAVPLDARGYARLLYASLHALDDAGCDLILVENVPASAEWAAVRDRLQRASRQR